MQDTMNQSPASQGTIIIRDAAPSSTSAPTLHTAPHALPAGATEQRAQGRILRSHAACEPGAHAAGVLIAAASPGAAATRLLDYEDAVAYMDEIKAQLVNEPHVYNSFLDALKQYKTLQIDTPTVVLRVAELLAAHPGLVQGFNTFLPVGYDITCSGATVTIAMPASALIAHRMQSVLALPPHSLPSLMA